MKLYHDKNINTIVDLLEVLNEIQPNDTAYQFYTDSKLNSQTIDYHSLRLKAITIAAALKAQGMNQGDRALLIYPPGLDLIAAYYGCLYAGVISVPVYPPMNPKLVAKLNYIVGDSKPSALLATGSFKEQVASMSSTFPSKLAILFTDEIESIAISSDLPEINRNTLAFLQYTSGSTSQPKGVMVSHGNLLHNIRLIAEAYNFEMLQNFVSWLPPYHDMGLISGILSPLIKGMPALLMSPLAFLKDPLMWLKVISQHEDVMSGAPNFAFNYCIARINDQQKAELDLSSWRVCYNGAEPIRKATLEHFVAAFQKCGLQKKAIYPSYGMAEATLYVSANNEFDKHEFVEISTEALRNNFISFEINNPTDCSTITSCGKMSQEVKIVNPDSLEDLPENSIGEIWVNSGSVCLGYWNKPELTETVFHAQIANATDEKRYLRTGDLGFIHDNQLYVTGRIKDLIIVHGKNYYPQDIEYIVEHSHPMIRKSCSIAFSVEVKNEERLVIVCETEKNEHPSEWQIIIDAICDALAQETELVAYSIVFLSSHSLPKTTSGKVQRQPCKKAWLEGKLNSTYSWNAPFFNDEEEQPVQSVSIDSEADELTEWILAWISRHNHQARATLSANRPFIEYGLDSIAIIHFVHDLNEYTGLVVDPGLVWEYQSPDKLAEYINSNQDKLPKLANTEIIPADTIRLSPGQERLWFMQQLEPQSTAFNIGCAFKLQGDIDVKQFEESCRSVINKHQVLNTAVPIIEGRPVPVIQKEMNDVFLSTRLTDVQPAIIEGILATETMKPYDLSEGSLFRLRLYRLNDNESIFLIAAHHIVCDGWSVSVFMRDLLHHYEKKTDHLASQNIQYYDFSNWQHQQLKSAANNEVLSYWKNYLENTPTYLPLPLDNQRTPDLLASIKTHQFSLPEGLAVEVDKFSQNEGITPFILFFTAFELLLSHYSNQKDLVIGIPVNGRTHTGTRNVIGFFVNTLPIRVMVDSDEQIDHLLQKNKATLNACYQHQNIPLMQLLSQLDIERDLSHEPLFQVLFVMQNMYPETLHGEKLNGKLQWTESGRLSYDLTLEVVPKTSESGQDYQLSIKYNEHLFNLSTIVNMTGHLNSLISGIVKKKSPNALQIPMITDDEKDKILRRWNEQSNDYLMHGMFEKQVMRTPDNCAVVVDGETITYQQLNKKANKLANYLRTVDIGPDTIVAISLPRSIDLVVSILAVLKSGAAYLYIDPANPAARTQEILTDSAAKFTIRELNWEQYQSFPDTNPSLAIDSKSLAYVLYTSGSTGRPKGVLIEHESICNHLHWYASTPIAVDKFLHLFSFSFDGAVAALWWPLVKGAAVYIPGNLQKPKEPIQDMISKEGITALHVTPGLLEGLLATAADFSAVKDIILAGEPFNVTLLNKIKQIFDLKRTHIWNLYGVSECAVISSCYQVSGNENRTIPIGKPVSDTTFYVLNEHLDPVPAGITGELYIGGSSLARSYLNRPELTAEKFVLVTIPGQPEQRLYKTGDWVRWNADGDLEYVGRTDNQVKLRGYRIELGEIESTLGNYPGIKEATVVIKERPSGQKCLVAYLVTSNGIQLKVDDIKFHLINHLPDYMIPEYWMFINEIPLTTNGKVDFKKLPLPDFKQSRENYVPPETERERLLTDIISKILKMEASEISIKDNFFDIGGDSILSIQFAHLCKTQEIPLTALDLFKCKTIKALAQRWTNPVIVVPKLPDVIQTKTRENETIGEKIANRVRQTMLKKYHPKSGTIEVHGTENIPQTRPLIIASNHAHFWDLMRVAPFLLKTLDLHDPRPCVLTARGLKYLHPVISLFVNPVYLNRNNSENDELALEKCIGLLETGTSVILSPEGQQNQQELIAPKTGVAFIASHGHGTILPVAIYKKKLDSRSMFGRRKKQLIVKIGHQIDNSNLDINKLTLTEITDKIMQEIATMVPEGMRGIYGNNFNRK